MTEDSKWKAFESWYLRYADLSEPMSPRYAMKQAWQASRRDALEEAAALLVSRGYHFVADEIRAIISEETQP